MNQNWHTLLAILITLLLPLVTPLTFSQATGQSSVDTLDTADASPDITTQEEIPDLERETLSTDIESLNFFQLIDWLQSLGLSTQGDRRTLQLRLYDHYNVTPVDTSVPESNRTATIESALLGDYFKQAESEENYFRLRGGVKIQFADRNQNVQHTIEAQEILFNQDEKIATARGQVHYTITRANKTEEFFGNTISFQVEDWNGYFISGGGTSTQNTGTSESFRYTADFISRSPEDVIVMDDVSITSSPQENPYYRIEASRVWILGEGEWGLRDATLYVGEIPLFYFPYFFRPGDEVVFHPVFGSRDREGVYIQTTTYLLGQKAASQDRFSFLQTSDGAGGQKVLDGIFLRSSPNIAEAAARPDGSLKLLLDYYSRLGVYAALEGSFNNIEPLQQLNFQTAIAASRYIYSTGFTSDSGLSRFTTLFLDNNSATEQWVQSNFLGLQLPFRYFLDLNTAISIEQFRSSILFELYSDAFITQDFGDRAEENDWFSIVSGSTSFISTTNAATTNSFQWRWESSWSASPVLGPLISNIAINDITFNLNWLSKTASSLPNYITSAHNSPGRNFFYPSGGVAPNVRVSISGALLNPQILRGEGFPELVIETEEDATAPPPQIPIDPLPPWYSGDTSTQEEEEEETEQELLRQQEVEPLSNYGGYNPTQPIDYGINYTLTTTHNIQYVTDNNEWQRADEVDFALLYSNYSTDNQLNLGYLFNLYNNYLRLSGSVDFVGRYQTLVSENELTESERRNLYNQAYNYHLFNIVNSTSLSSQFLQEIDSLSSTSLQYDITTNIYQYKLDRVDSLNNPIYKTTLLDWNPETITNHAARFNLIWNVLEANQSLTFDYRLPPLDQRFASQLGLTFGWWQIGAQFSATEEVDSDEWKLDALRANTSLNPLDEVSLSSNIAINLEESYVESLNFSLRVWILNSSLAFAHVQGVRFNPTFLDTTNAELWIAEGEEMLLPTQLSASINETIPIDPLWKNRIRFGISIGSNLNIDLQRFTQSSFGLNLGFSFFVHEFLELSVNSSILNNQIYRYIPQLAAITGRETRNLFLDILQSINIFNMADLEETFFKLQNINLQLTHYLVDWDLRFSYTASPTLITEGNQLPRYEWDQRFSIFVEWKPIPELRKDIQIDREGNVLIDESS